MIPTEFEYTNAAIGNDPKVLQDIHTKSKNIAIFRRSIDTLLPELNRIAGKEIECRASGAEAEVLSTLEAFFGIYLSECTNLLADVSDLFALFVEATQASSFRFLLTTVSTNMCRKFHTDVNDLRLLCTYVGPGTLWIPDESINIKELQAGSEESEILLDGHQIQQIQTGEVVLLKGALYSGAQPILHRSPSIEDQGAKRLLLRIDTNEFLNFLA